MNTQLKNRKIILGVTGGIAAYKSCTLCRLLIKAGADVYVCMTEAATQLVGKATFEALSGHTVTVGIFDRSKEISHVSLASSADMVIIAPATANTIAKIAAGMADNMITAVTLAATCPVVVAPAMNTNMYRNPATQENISTLLRRGLFIVPPASGELACGTTGEGRMKEPEEVFEYICSLFANRIGTKPQMLENSQARLPSPDSPLELTQTKLLPKSYGVGFKVLITAGPTQELIDPVRYISNKSSGKMGFALARVAADLGAEVTLISGPVKLDTPEGVRRIDVKSAVQMLQAVESHVSNTDIFIGTAAVADYRAENSSPVKIKKTDDTDSITLKLVKNPDIIATVGRRESNRPFTVGFAAETNNCEENAKEKLLKKHLDLVVLNDVSRKDIAFDSDDNEVFVFDKDGQVAHFEKQPKAVLAAYLMELIFKAAKK
ncbi:MAG: bifunctional phosphopantothenoylcysteine decarboxylase/phosphopantothenate--cysteine ligase CoaBC [Succinivibrio sp.]